MPTVDVPWPLSSAPGASPQESGGRLINCTAEPLGDASPVKVVWRRRPGLSALCDTALTPFRGGIQVNNLAYIAVGTKIVTVTSGGFQTLVGTLPGDDKVTFAQNNQSPTPAIQCVSPENGAFAVTSSSVAAFSGGGNLPTPNSVCSQDGYFFWSIGDNRVFAAGPNSTVVNALTFQTVQSRPTGGLLRVVPYQGLLFCFADDFTEIYSDTSNPSPGFPYSRYAVIDRGLRGRNAITGYEEAFGQLHWVGDDCGVYRLNGPTPLKVSPPDLDRLIQSVSDPETLEMLSYVIDGKSFVVVAAPGFSWELNLNTDRWNERDSFSSGQYVRWRPTGSFHAFGKWLMGDTLSTQLIYPDQTTQQELGSPLRMRMESAPVAKFPNRTAIARSDFNFVTGVGQSSSSTDSGLDPQVALSASRDGGVTWVGPRFRRLGQQAHSRQRVYATNWGMSTSQGSRWRLDLTDEVYAAFMGATISNDIRAH